MSEWKGYEMDYIHDKDLFKAVMFTCSLIDQSLSPKAAITKASNYYGVDAEKTYRYWKQRFDRTGKKGMNDSLENLEEPSIREMDEEPIKEKPKLDLPSKEEVKSAHVQVLMKPSTKTALNRIAKEYGISTNELINYSLLQFINWYNEESEG